MIQLSTGFASCCAYFCFHLLFYIYKGLALQFSLSIPCLRSPLHHLLFKTALNHSNGLISPWVTSATRSHHLPRRRHSGIRQASARVRGVLPVNYRPYKHLTYAELIPQEAIDVAIKEFPDQLGHIPRHRISFMLQANMSGTKRCVRVSESAWPMTVCRLVRAEVVEVVVTEDRKSSPAPTTEAPPPTYLEVPGTSTAVDEKPVARTKSRSPSPSGRRSPSGLSWFSRGRGTESA